jgi:hypothetical protein
MCLRSGSRNLSPIAGHSSITITQHYVHPQADAIERAFTQFGEENMSTEQHLVKYLRKLLSTPAISTQKF